MASVFDVAECVLAQTGYVSTMKLQKLVFYSQAYALVATGQPLFGEDFEAWVNGPVCPSLFKAHRGLFVIGPEDLAAYGSVDGIDALQRSLIGHVLHWLGGFDGNELSQFTHKEAPWLEARKGCGPVDRCNAVITKESMRTYYGSSRCANPAFQG